MIEIDVCFDSEMQKGDVLLLEDVCWRRGS